MTQTKNNIDSRKGKHLSYAERCQIEVLKKDDYSNRQIAGILERVSKTIHNENRRGTITQLKRQKKTARCMTTMNLFIVQMRDKITMIKSG